MTADTNQTVDNIAEHTHFIQTEIVKQTDIMQTRLANVFDSLKTLHVKESNNGNPSSAQQRNLSPKSPSYSSKQPETDSRVTQRKTLIVGDSILNKVKKMASKMTLNQYISREEKQKTYGLIFKAGI